MSCLYSIAFLKYVLLLLFRSGFRASGHPSTKSADIFTYAFYGPTTNCSQQQHSTQNQQANFLHTPSLMSAQLMERAKRVNISCLRELIPPNALKLSKRILEHIMKRDKSILIYLINLNINYYSKKHSTIQDGKYLLAFA